MAAPAATRSKVRYRLLDTSSTNPQLDDATTLDEAIARAVARYSKDRPRLAVANVTGTGSSFYQLVSTAAPTVDQQLASWSNGYSNIVSIEYPAATPTVGYVPSYLKHQIDWTDDYLTTTGIFLQLLSAAPSTSETMRIIYTILHQHTSLVDSIPANDLDALCDLAAHFGCQILATRAAGQQNNVLSADSTEYRDAQLRYSQQAKAWLASYLDHLGVNAESGTAPATSANSSWYQHYQSGAPFLTHQIRRR